MKAQSCADENLQKLAFEFTGYCSEPFTLLWIECGEFALKRHKEIMSMQWLAAKAQLPAEGR